MNLRRIRESWQQALSNISADGPEEPTDPARRKFMDQTGSYLLSMVLPKDVLVEIAGFKEAIGSISEKGLRRAAEIYIAIYLEDNGHELNDDVAYAVDQHFLKSAIRDAISGRNTGDSIYFPEGFPETGEDLFDAARKQLARSALALKTSKDLEAILRSNPDKSRQIFEEIDRENDRRFSLAEEDGEVWHSRWEKELLRMSQQEWEELYEDDAPEALDVYLSDGRDEILIEHDDNQIFVYIAKLTGKILPETPGALKAELAALKAAGGLKKKMPWNEAEKVEWEKQVAKDKEVPENKVDASQTREAQRMAAQIKALGGGEEPDRWWTK